MEMILIKIISNISSMMKKIKKNKLITSNKKIFKIMDKVIMKIIIIKPISRNSQILSWNRNRNKSKNRNKNKD